jgi:CPA2 family monovalent cation:H+ antiporter-2
MRHGHRISRLLVHASDETLLLSVLALVLLVGAAAEQLHVSAAVGAFLVGTALSDPVADRAQHLIRPLRDLFAATFFLFFALGIAPSSLLAMLWMAVGLWVVGVVGKVLTGWWAARQAGIGPRGAMRAGTALIARGEFSILIAQLAASTHAGADLPALVGGYVLLCAISGPVLARWADRLADGLPGRTAAPI